MTRAPLDAVASLGDPLRRRLYELASSRAAGITREDAARAADVPRHVAAYHLDRLAAHGLLDVERRRSGARSGPGAGRPAKVYRRAAQPLDVSLPPRNYRLASRVLLDAVTPQQLSVAARCHGVEMGAAARAQGGGDALLAVLRDSGFEPVRDGATVRLRNCAFHELAEQDRETVCAMNLALMRGVAEGLGLPATSARRDVPASGGCCVAFRLSGAIRSRSNRPVG